MYSILMAGHHFLRSFLLMIINMFFCSQLIIAVNQSQFFTQMNKSFTGNNLSYWDVHEDNNFCNYKGVACNSQGNIEKIDIYAWDLSGRFPQDVCSYLPYLRILRLGGNNLYGSFPSGITNCSLLEELRMDRANLSGTLPDLSPLQSLRLLDLSYNSFQGKFPISITNLTNLETINFDGNEEFDSWQLPEDISRLTKLQIMILTGNLQGKIPASIGNMTSLTVLVLSSYSLIGQLPPELGQLRNLRRLELCCKLHEGEIPQDFGNLTELLYIDMPFNKFTKLPESLCRLPKLQYLHLDRNFLTGGIPAVLGNSTTLTSLSLSENLLMGKVPENLGRSSPLVFLDLSENQLAGELPPYLCKGGKLMYFLVLQNKFSGQIPESYANCNSLLSFRVNYNQLTGSIPEGLLALQHASIIDLSDNCLNGSIARTIENAKNLSELHMQNNRISGFLPSQISRAVNLKVLDISDNLLSGPIPSEIGNLRQLNLLLLRHNKLSSSIPQSISSLKRLGVLDLSNNSLTGNIPESISDLLPNSLNFKNNMLSGPIPRIFVFGNQLESFTGNPSLCVAANMNTSITEFPLCPQTFKISYILSIALPAAIVIIVGLILFLKLWFKNDKATMENKDTLLSSFFHDEVKSFHHRRIIESMIDRNIVGRGGFGTVYKVGLSNGVVVAVKKLRTRKGKVSVSSDELELEKELKIEVDTLGDIRHKNIVKLFCYFCALECNLLVYEYMENGNLWDALHGGNILLNWPTRHQIALGAAQGLAYLHHHLLSPVIHRDIKSSNILLDAEHQPKLADFGLAKILQASRVGKGSITTGIAGTFGYLAPEYACTSRASTKCDVYSFGVILMELVTGRKPLEEEFEEGNNIIHWILSKVESKETAFEVLDHRISGSFEDGMIKVLRLAMHCTNWNPALRPTMNEVVQLLTEAGPCDFDSS